MRPAEPPGRRDRDVGDGGLADRYVADLAVEFPRLRFIHKPSDPLSRLIDGALRVLTLGGQSRYLSHYVTTLGSRIYLPDGWETRSDADRYVTLRHEAVHLRQFRRYGFVLMSFLYLIPVLPMGLAWGRAVLEWEAYRETLVAVAEVSGREAASDPAFHERIVRQFTGAAYGWMWPFPEQIRRWIRQTVEELP